ncbi:hypothetical protein [Aeromicrobium sp. P5_D10]
MKSLVAKRAIPSFVASVVLGLVGGVTYHAAFGQEASTSADDPGKTYAELEPKDELPPAVKLNNGKTVGLWRLDTPIDERPDYVASQLADGTPGYLKRTDVDDGYVMTAEAARGDVVVSTPEELRAEQARLKAMVQPDANGEIWVPLYAEDGETVLGKVLMGATHDD